MALLATLTDDFGETRELYVRLNSFEQLANHGVPAMALFRGFASREAFENGGRYLWQKVISFEADAPQDPWKMAYDRLKELPEFADAAEV